MSFDGFCREIRCFCFCFFLSRSIPNRKYIAITNKGKRDVVSNKKVQAKSLFRPQLFVRGPGSQRLPASTHSILITAPNQRKTFFRYERWNRNSWAISREKVSFIMFMLVIGSYIFLLLPFHTTKFSSRLDQQKIHPFCIFHVAPTAQ